MAAGACLETLDIKQTRKGVNHNNIKGRVGAGILKTNAVIDGRARPDCATDE
jgi:hypothetical protein